MKKIVALVLSLVMVLGLATTAFGAITLWGSNTETVECDVFDAAYNTKLNPQTVPVEFGYNPGQALKYDLKTGAVAQWGVIPFYFIDEDGNGKYGTGEPTFVLVSEVPADATPAEVAKYFLVKAHDKTIEEGKADVDAQTAKDAYYILKAVACIDYVVEATEFTDWSKDCEGYAKPATALATDKYYTVANKVTNYIADDTVKYAKAAGLNGVYALVDGEVVVLDVAKTVSATKHAWLASAWDAKKVPTEYTCNTCKVVGTVVNSPLNAPAGAKLDNFGGTLIAYTFPVVEAPVVDTDKVESAQTFDAGIAMYVGMSVMAAAGSAVVLKKKD